MRGGCSSAGRAGRLVIERSLVQIPAPGKAELHVEVSLSKILNPTLLISEGLSREYPALALRQGWDWLQQQHPVTPWKGISGYRPWHDMTWHINVKCSTIYYNWHALSIKHNGWCKHFCITCVCIWGFSPGFYSSLGSKITSVLGLMKGWGFTVHMNL